MDSNTIVRVYQDATDVLVPSAEFFTDQLAATAADRIAVAADRVAADADAAATAADRTAVAADRTATHADKLAADADAAATAADRTAVASDKATVAADKATVAADKATVAADKATVATDKATVATDRAAAETASTSAQAQALSAGEEATAAGASAAEAATSAATASDAADDADATRDAIQAQIDGYPGAAGQTIPVATVDLLAAIDPPVGPAYVYEDGREGEYKEADYAANSALVDASYNLNGGLAKRSTADPTSAWLRIGELKPQHFANYALGPSVDCLGPLQAFWDAVIEERRVCDATGDFGVAGQLILGPSAIQPKGTIPMRGAMRLTQLTATFETLRMRHLQAQTFHGDIIVNGIGSGSFASRTCAVGVAFEDCGSLTISGLLDAEKFWYCGMITPVDNNDAMQLGIVINKDCGSGHHFGGTATLEATWSGTSNAGSANSTSQTTTISNISAFPDAAIETYLTLANQVVHVRINNYLYRVNSWDRVAGTITVFPWLDNASIAAGSGTLEWCFGAGAYIQGSDGNIIHFQHHNASRCGRGIVEASLYGSKIGSANYATCGTGIVSGRLINGSHIGTEFGALYIESDVLEQFVNIPVFGGSNWGYVNGGYEINLAKFWKLSAARNSSGDLTGTTMGGTGNATAIALVEKGRRFEAHWQDNSTADPSTFTFDRHGRPPLPLIQYRDSQTISLSVIGDQYQRLFGYRGCKLGYLGTGTNSAPSGTFTFNPPTRSYTSVVTTNGSAVATMTSTRGLAASMPVTGTGIPGSTTILSVDSDTQVTLSANATASGTITMTATGSINGAYTAATFSDFDGPAMFSVAHSDVYQLVWIVRCFAGKMRDGFTGVDQRTNGSATLNTTSSKKTQYLDVALTSARTVTLPSPGKAGRRFTFVRSANATGAFNWNINTSSAVLVKALATAGTWAQVEDDGTEYRLIGSGSL